MLIFDGDYPMAYGAIDLNRNLTRPLAEVRAADGDAANVAMACLPELRRGGVAAALVKVAARILRDGSVLPGFRGPEAAHGAARGELAYYEALARRGEATVLTTAPSLTGHLERWEASETDTDGLPVGFVLGLEGADPILSPDEVGDWWDAGIRVVSLTHYGVSTYAHGTGTRGGLLPPAAGLLREMERCGMCLDLTHIADDGFWQAVDLFGGPLLASHQNCRALAPGERQFSDAQLRLVIERGGVIGASMDTWMLLPEQLLDWRRAGTTPRRDCFPRDAVTLQHLADHIDHVCQLAGNAEHAAIGGDTDGQGGVDGAPHEIDTVADYQKLAPILRDRGYTQDEVADIMYRNWQRFYERTLPAS